MCLICYWNKRILTEKKIFKLWIKQFSVMTTLTSIYIIMIEHCSIIHIYIFYCLYVYLWWQHSYLLDLGFKSTEWIPWSNLNKEIFNNQKTITFRFPYHFLFPSYILFIRILRILDEAKVLDMVTQNSLVSWVDRWLIKLHNKLKYPLYISFVVNK